MTSMTDTPGARESWIKVLGVIVVAEVAVLWLATSLSLWRRRAMAAVPTAPAPTAPAPTAAAPTTVTPTTVTRRRLQPPQLYR
jgi:hypothetical protein